MSSCVPYQDHLLVDVTVLRNSRWVCFELQVIFSALFFTPEIVSQQTHDLEVDHLQGGWYLLHCWMSLLQLEEEETLIIEWRMSEVLVDCGFFQLSRLSERMLWHLAFLLQQLRWPETLIHAKDYSASCCSFSECIWETVKRCCSFTAKCFFLGS